MLSLQDKRLRVSATGLPRYFIIIESFIVTIVMYSELHDLSAHKMSARCNQARNSSVCCPLLPPCLDGSGLVYAQYEEVLTTLALLVPEHRSSEVYHGSCHSFGRS